jgi:hypothetical protein
MDLRTTATMAGWPTPRLADGESSGMRWGRGKADTLTAVATHLAGWPSPQAADGKGSGKNQHTVSLCQTTKAVLAGWHLWISAGGVAALHHKRNRLAHNSMKSGAVVDATLNQINEIARCQRRSSTI